LKRGAEKSYQRPPAPSKKGFRGDDLPQGC
jgi:hypothetical protein